MTTTDPSRDVHVRCLTPDLAASTFRLLKASHVHPALLVGSLVVVETDGSDAQVDHVVGVVRSSRLASSARLLEVRETPPHLRALALSR